MFGADFYPTPAHLIDKMLEHVQMDHVNTILEPSAGRGDIIGRLNDRERYNRHREIDVIEIDPELGMVLEGKGHKPIARDFLEFTTFRLYDLIVMNPPFSKGDKHLLKALTLQRDGGQIVCLLNAETIKNPYTNSRKELVALIDKYSGSVEYITDAFENATRRTEVDIALVYLDIPRSTPRSDILNNLVEARELEEATGTTHAELVEGDYILGAVRRYEIEVSTGLKFIGEYEALKPILSRSFSKDNLSMIELLVDGEKYGNTRNALVRRTRMKYWQELFQTSEFSKLFTSKTQRDYQTRIDDLARYEFNVSNIKQMQLELSQSMLGSLDDSIVRLFDEFSNQYWDEQSNNIHYYNGWKTNKAYIVNKKVITQCHAFDSWDGTLKLSFYDHATEKLLDIHKVFSYLNGAVMNDHTNFFAALDAAQQIGKSRDITLEYCKVSFYKKGTAHITFTNEKLLKKFNLIGSQRKGWLPPNYAKADYRNMTQEEREVVDSFEGEESYAETVRNHDFYQMRANLAIGIEAGLEVTA